MSGAMTSRCSVSGWMPVDEFGELLGIELPPHRYNTVAGLVLQQFNVLPNVGDAFDLSGWHIEVVDLDGGGSTRFWRAGS